VFPIGDIAWAWSFGIEDDPPVDHNARTYAFDRLVTPGFHAALGIPLLEGRHFAPRRTSLANLVEREVLNRVAGPVTVVEVPPLELVDLEALGFHGVPEQLAVPALP